LGALGSNPSVVSCAFRNSFHNDHRTSFIQLYNTGLHTQDQMSTISFQCKNNQCISRLYLWRVRTACYVFRFSRGDPPVKYLQSHSKLLSVDCSLSCVGFLQETCAKLRGKLFGLRLSLPLRSGDSFWLLQKPCDTPAK